jgi:choline dehydrogenase-like flavoprotein
VLEGKRAAGIEFRDADGGVAIARVRREIVLSCGAIDTPRLLLLSGIGPREVLQTAGIDVAHELPGVARALGITFPDRIVAIAPNVAKPRSRGTVRISSPDPDAAPVIDYRYFTDPGGHDERMLIAGVRAARTIAEREPFRRWLVREVFPGTAAQSDLELSRVQRAVHQTVYHVSGTCRIGAAADDLAVVDPRLRVRGLSGLRVADASVFPTIPSVNPVITVLMVGERAADLIRQDAA